MMKFVLKYPVASRKPAFPEYFLLPTLICMAILEDGDLKPDGSIPLLHLSAYLSLHTRDGESTAEHINDILSGPLHTTGLLELSRRGPVGVYWFIFRDEHKRGTHGEELYFTDAAVGHTWQLKATLYEGDRRIDSCLTNAIKVVPWPGLIISEEEVGYSAEEDNA